MEQQQKRSCVVCHSAGATLRCSRCQSPYYCGRECQRSHWARHKSVCVASVSRKKEEERPRRSRGIAEEEEELWHAEAALQKAKVSGNGVYEAFCAEAVAALCDSASERAMGRRQYETCVGLLRRLLEVLPEAAWRRRFAVLNNLSAVLNAKCAPETETLAVNEAKIALLRKVREEDHQDEASSSSKSEHWYGPSPFARALVELSTSMSRLARDDEAESYADEASRVLEEAYLRPADEAPGTLALVRHRQGAVALAKGNSILAKHHLTEVISTPKLRKALPTALLASLGANLKRAVDAANVALDPSQAKLSLQDLLVDAETLYLARRDAQAAAKLFAEVLLRLDGPDKNDKDIFFAPTLAYLHNLQSIDIHCPKEAAFLKSRLLRHLSRDYSPRCGLCDTPLDDDDDNNRERRTFLTPCAHAFHFQCLLRQHASDQQLQKEDSPGCPLCDYTSPTYLQRLKAFTATPFL